MEDKQIQVDGYSFKSLGVKFRTKNKRIVLYGGKLASISGQPINKFAVVTAPLGSLLHSCLKCDVTRHVVAGACARVASQVIVHPIDTIKTRQYVQFPNEQLRQWRIVVGKQCSQLGPFKLPRAISPFLKGDAWLGLWGAVLGTLPVGLVYYSVYENVCQRWEGAGIGASGIHLIAAAAGGLFSDIFRVPADTIRHRVQAYMHPNVFHAAQEIIQKDGIKGFYRGFTPTLMRDIPELALTFGTYEMLRNYCMKKEKGKKLQTWQHLLLGGISGAVAGIVTNPMDVMKCSIQTASVKMPLHVMAPELIRKQGLGLFVVGLGPRVAQLALQNACMFVMFEYLKSVIKPVTLREPDDRSFTWKITGKRRTHIWKRQFS
eukprot:TRINITY_DN20212_c0_g1_i3.p1 TRINITY_DN20212_c0_g1~~TRINITY_DN20212_c0_g1_i3.p1  ORF type:complete len:375 (-),score=47.57 TRINITY_DN20212_c0_g1_i3:1117-2241(-)